jgi:hypothetical protein
MEIGVKRKFTDGPFIGLIGKVVAEDPLSKVYTIEFYTGKKEEVTNEFLIDFSVNYEG